MGCLSVLVRYLSFTGSSQELWERPHGIFGASEDDERERTHAPRSVLFSGLLYTLACVDVEAIGLLQ